MEGQSQGIIFQHVFARNRAHLISQDPLEEAQCWRPRWYYSKKEIEERSPSRKDGIDFKKETKLRGLYCSFVLDLGMKLKVPQLTIATAMMFCHRFYLHQSHVKNDWQTIGTVSMFLACKVEETPRMLVDVIVVAYEILYSRDPADSQRIKQKDVYEKQKRLILIGERLLMATIGFDFNIQHPYKPLVAALKKLDMYHNDMAKVAWNFVNDWLRTTLCLQYKPPYIAACSMYLAAKYCKVKLPSEKGKVWWMEFDVSPNQLEEVTKQMLKILENNNRPKMSSSHEKVTQTALVKKATSTSPQSCVLSEREATNESINGIGENVGTVKSRHSSDACASDSHILPNDICFVRNGEVSQCQTRDCVLDGCKESSESLNRIVENAEASGKYGWSRDACLDNRRQILPSEDICVIRKGEVSQCQTSDCGSSQSVVEDGNRIDEGVVQPRLGGCNQTVASTSVSDCGGLSKIDIVSDSGGLSKIDKLEGCNQTAASTSVSYCGGLSKVDIVSDSGGLSMINELVGCNQTAASTSVSDCGGLSKIDIVSESGRSSKNDELEGCNQTAACASVSDCGGLSKVDTDSNSGGLSKIDIVSESGGSSKNDELEGCNQTAACASVSDCGGRSKVDTVSNSGGPSKSDKLEGCNQTAACTSVSDRGELSKIDKDRIREALRKRKYEKAMNKKGAAKLDDGKDSDYWIMQELENGIELGSVPAAKRQRV